MSSDCLSAQPYKLGQGGAVRKKTYVVELLFLIDNGHREKIR